MPIMEVEDEEFVKKNIYTEEKIKRAIIID